MKLKKHENLCNSHDNSYMEMPKKDKDLSKHNYREKSMKLTFIYLC